MSRGVRRGLLVLGAFLLALAAASVLNPYPMPMTALVLGLLGLAALLWWRFYNGSSARGRRGLRLLAVIALICTVGLGAAMGLIREKGRTDWSRAETSEYAVVLGAGVREDGTASRIMRSRLRAAQELMERNPDVVVILSGSQGPGVPRSEASCMYDTLIEWGADEARLLQEDQSGTTRENLVNSMAIIDAHGGTKKPLAVISSDFHTARAVYIADTLNIDACPVAARTDQWYFRFNYTLREVFAFVKAWLQRGSD